MLSAYGDESHDQGRENVFVVAALLGDENCWKSFQDKWSERTGGIVFHAAECESGYGAYKIVSEDERHRLYRSLTTILAESHLFGWGCAIDMKGCRAAFPETLADVQDMPYYDCFTKTVVKLCDVAEHFIPPERVDFTFDQHKEIQYNTGLLYEWISNNRPIVAERIRFSTRKEVGIQAADLWARELMKRCAGYMFNERTNPRPTYMTLRQSGRFGGDFLMASYFASMKEQMEEVMRKAGFSNTAYVAWLRQNRLPDNVSNRFRYVTTLEGGPIAYMRENPGDVVQP